MTPWYMDRDHPAMVRLLGPRETERPANPQTPRVQRVGLLSQEELRLRAYGRAVKVYSKVWTGGGY